MGLKQIHLLFAVKKSVLVNWIDNGFRQKKA